LPQVDEIVMIDKGLIVEIGTYDLLLDKNGTFAEYITSIHSSIQNKNDSISIDKLLNGKQKCLFISNF